MSYDPEWTGTNRWKVIATAPGFPDMDLNDLLTFGGTGVPADSTLSRNNSPWGDPCEHKAPGPLAHTPDYVVVHTGPGGRPFVVVRDNRTTKHKLLCFTGTVPPEELPEEIRGTPTVACWTAQDG